MKKVFCSVVMVAAMASVSLHAAPKSKSAVNLVDNYEVVQSAVPEGGYVVAQGTPEEVAGVEGSYTGQYLKHYL